MVKTFFDQESFQCNIVRLLEHTLKMKLILGIIKQVRIENVVNSKLSFLFSARWNHL